MNVVESVFWRVCWPRILIGIDFNPTGVGYYSCGSSAGELRSSHSLGTNTEDLLFPRTAVHVPCESMICRPSLLTVSPLFSDSTGELCAELLWKTVVESVLTFSMGVL